MASLEATNKSTLGLARLPQELFDDILHHLSFADATSLLRTSRGLYNANYHPVLRKFIHQKPGNRDYLYSWAALRGHITIIDFALQEGLDVNSLVQNDDTDWYQAKVLEILQLQGSSQPDDVMSHSLPLLHYAIARNHSRLATWLLDKGGEPLTIGKGPAVFGTAIAVAIEWEWPDTNLILGAYQKEPYTTTSALYRALIHGYHEYVRDLCDLGADVNDGTSPDCGSPLVTAVEKKDLTSAQVLLDRGANVDAVVCIPQLRLLGNRKANALMAAALKGHEAMMELLIIHGAELNGIIKDGEHNTPMCIAVRLNNLRAAKLLLKYGADPNLVGSSLAWTAYGTELRALRHRRRCDAATLNLLAAYGADPNCRQWNQPPAVFLAMQLGITNQVRREIFVQVLDHGADVNGVLPHDLYYQGGNIAPYSPSIEFRFSALHDCLSRTTCNDRVLIEDGVCKESMVTMLLDRGADPLAGFQVPLGREDVMRTPLGHFMTTAGQALAARARRGLASIEHTINAMLSFVSHPRGAQSTAAFNTYFMASLLGIVALLPSGCCQWYGPTQEAQIRRFADETCVGARAAQGKDAWLATLLKSFGYWSLSVQSTWLSRDTEVWSVLTQGAGKLSAEHREEEDEDEDGLNRGPLLVTRPMVRTLTPFAPVDKKRKREDDEDEEDEEDKEEVQEEEGEADRPLFGNNKKRKLQ